MSPTSKRKRIAKVNFKKANVVRDNLGQFVEKKEKEKPYNVSTDLEVIQNKLMKI